MNIEKVTGKILLKNRNDALRVCLYVNLVASGVKPYDKDLDVIIDLYNMGGYDNQSKQNSFFERCISEGYKRSIQSIRNTLAKYTDIGLLLKPKNNQRYVSTKWLPLYSPDSIIFLDYKISHGIN